MSDPLRASKAFGAAGALLLHLLVICACVFKAPQPMTKPLPSAEPLRINVAEAPAAPLRPPRPVSKVPETKPPVQRTAVQDIAPLAQKTPMPAESGPSGLPDAQSTPPQFAEPLPERPTAAPIIVQRPRQEREKGAQTIEDAKQAIISLLIASLEREKRYPAAARRLGIEGQVMALVRLDSQGVIIGISAKASGAESILESATLDALRRVQKKWVSTPLPEPMILNIPVRYNLERR